MDDKHTINIPMNSHECGFLLSAGEPEIGIDLAIKLSLARVSSKPVIMLSLSELEHVQLLHILKKNAVPTAMRETKQLSEKLIDRFKQASKQTIVS